MDKRELLIFLTPTIIDPEAQTGYEKYYDGLPDTEAYTDDSWMPADNAKPRKFSFRDDAPAQNAAAESAAGEPVAAEPVAEPACTAYQGNGFGNPFHGDVCSQVSILSVRRECGQECRHHFSFP